MSSTEIRGKVLVAIELPINYTVRLGLHPLVMSATMAGSYSPITVLPADAQEQLMNAVIEAAQEEAADRALEVAQLNAANAEGRDA